MPGREITAQQVELFMKARGEAQTQEAASAKAGVSERTGRRISDQRRKAAKNAASDPIQLPWILPKRAFVLLMLCSSILVI